MSFITFQDVCLRQELLEYMSVHVNDAFESSKPSWGKTIDPTCPLLIGRGFLATASTVINCKKAKIAVGEGVTRSIFGVKEIDLGDEEVPCWTTLGKRESYEPRPSTDGIGVRPPYYAKKDFKNQHLPGEWEIARDAKESEKLIENKMDWNRTPKERDGAWHIRIELIDPDRERFDRAFQSIPTTRKLSTKENPNKISTLHEEAQKSAYSAWRRRHNSLRRRQKAQAMASETFETAFEVADLKKLIEDSAGQRPRRFVLQMREEVQTSSNQIAQLNALIAEMEAFDNPGEVSNC
ncbi:hypothetical protein Tco_0336118 [Tanacetum coccineum]